MYSRIVVAAVSFALFVSPTFAAAQATNSSNPRLIALLSQLVQILEQELQQLLVQRAATQASSGSESFSGIQVEQPSIQIRPQIPLPKNPLISVSTQQSDITQGSDLEISWQSQDAPTGSQVALWRVNGTTGDSTLVQYAQAIAGQYAAYVRRDGEPLPTCPVTGGSYWPTGCWNYAAWPAGTYKITAKLYTPNGALIPSSYLSAADSNSFTVVANPYHQQPYLPTTCTSYNNTTYNEGEKEPPLTIIGDQFASAYPTALNFSTLVCASGWWASSVDNADYCSYLRYALGSKGQYATISFPNGVCSVTGSSGATQPSTSAATPSH